MPGPFKFAVIAGIGFSLTSFTPLPAFSNAALEALDPTRLATLFCGARRPGSSLAQNLLVASAFAAPASEGRPIPLFPDLATSRFPVTTDTDQARRYFSQGLLLTYGFNHAGAVRSFREAQRLDRDCAICWWGEAVALGPNINAPMDERDRDAALGAMDRAMALRSSATPMERALIEAVAKRYSRDPASDRAALDANYADAMLDVARRFPADDDVAVLAAEAVMDTSPWNYWESDKKTSVGRSGEAVRLVETVLNRNPAHVQANHLYIHLMEASDPQRAEAAADRLASPAAPSAAHLVHMPGHIFQLRGRHADSIRVNVAAARADEEYIRSAGDNGLVRYGYYPHNIHFIVTSAQMAGDMRTAIREAQRLRTVLDPATSAQIAWIQSIDAAPYFAMAQFADPKAILAMPAPDPRLAYPTAMRHFARSIAYAGLRNRKAFDRELAAMAKIRASDAMNAMIEQGVPAGDLVSLAEFVARGRFASAMGRTDEAIGFYRQAIAIEAGLPYQEPSYWYYPVKQSLGSALFRARRYGEASEAFRAALAQTPNNGWALYGLGRSEAAQGNRLEAAAADKALSKAWIGDKAWLRMDRL
ncbi:MULTISPECIES: tetratricopeptide repeat protein [unclassified Sphingopyxis]|jgi:tetratricopeptide (TPR) repeat protein|uniref:tetratricopeptide repeat protein n=1 Tax=unclassified Sphingopyxis TaxID=2614943 RepID=UPI0006C4E634|nr:MULTISPECIES: tetratricopeptide repeat protein [unclassified Sphingopyxis]USI76689.1 tetratricopeptide repeat protein [Sphingopyxis sp. USTB-05]GAO80891.1 TPR repeat [Sphingopyxis sp. C-1]